LSNPLLAAATSSTGAGKQLLIGVLATGHNDPSFYESLETQIRRTLLDIGARLRLVRREAGFVQAELVRQVSELMSLHPDVLICLDLVSATVAKAHRPNESIPIVFLAHADPLASNLVQSYAHPGNNVTGVTTYRCVDGKMMEILTDTFPARKRIGYLLDASIDDKTCVEQARRTASRVQVDLIRIDVSPPDFVATLREHLESLRLDAVLAPASAPVWQSRKAVVEALNDLRLPAIYESDVFLAEGGLMSYGPVRTDAIPQVVKSVRKILRGESAGDIPVDQPALFEFVMNLRAPHFSEFGIKATTLRRADRILE
jgi:putative ABC transport system substrate-binding protein